MPLSPQHRRPAPLSSFLRPFPSFLRRQEPTLPNTSFPPPFPKFIPPPFQGGG